MNDRLDQIISQMRDSVYSGASSKLKNIVDDYATYTFKENPNGQKFNELIFDFVVEMMGQSVFLNMKDSHYLLMLFDYDWSTLTTSQLERLLDSIVESYDKYVDWMSCFVLSKLLGQNYCNEEALIAVIKLAKTSQEIPRSLLPMALEYLTQNDKDMVLKNRSVSELTKFASDPSERVRQEALESLHRLRCRGIVQKEVGS